MPTQGTLKERETHGRARKGVVGIFDPHELLAPGGGVGGDQAAESHVQVLVGSLRLAAGLGVEPGGQPGQRPNECAEHFP
jgi:hypothetical protein